MVCCQAPKEDSQPRRLHPPKPPFRRDEGVAFSGYRELGEGMAASVPAKSGGASARNGDNDERKNVGV